ncbi:sigma-70 family RNA polymerase sigma factor [Comamonas thiooxydans]|uniref:Sigma-70 family RNA polymerase sigma factor n=1 Tax=Comamonas thiooxydans TaxID=363952 RepID=A0AA42PW54_9BURK|nr:sigma-70 family RNA polymerase sigma factor [Comamonas thiooxydans]MDH1332720.1 sigma-70 family RNA polymerase sigma factor [Comamonas thiooxydans]MDH1475282.1 sigma-70 family RNA polymerase sigma factor [Comamonas thiooxydans]MDH1739731.1 sigma-70 family RNA polymerase sigma factor [Comamonas thiooxydans]MDH1785147.1 sigma-70 family RNA polymerase sigma factor [Comamonas thiooxydans]
MIFSAESRYNQWVREHYRFLLRSAWALTGSRATAEDVVQDCFTSAWRFRHQLRDQSMARAWLFQIMRRHAFRHFDPVQSQTESLDEACEQGVNHHDALDAQLDVVKALSRIAPIHREVLVLYYFDDMPTAQMAEALDIAPGTVLSRLARAREALKTVLQEPARRPAGATTESSAAAGVIPLKKRAP